MFARNQLDTLFSMIEDLEGSMDDVDSSALSDLRKEVERLKGLEQSLVVGAHVHRHGQSDYAFLVSKRDKFDFNLFEAMLEEDFEPHRGEELTWQTIEPTVIPPAKA